MQYFFHGFASKYYSSSAQCNVLIGTGTKVWWNIIFQLKQAGVALSVPELHLR